MTFYPSRRTRVERRLTGLNRSSLAVPARLSPLIPLRQLYTPHGYGRQGAEARAPGPARATETEDVPARASPIARDAAHSGLRNIPARGTACVRIPPGGTPRPHARSSNMSAAPPARPQ